MGYFSDPSIIWGSFMCHKICFSYKIRFRCRTRFPATMDCIWYDFQYWQSISLLSFVEKCCLGRNADRSRGICWDFSKIPRHSSTWLRGGMTKSIVSFWIVSETVKSEANMMNSGNHDNLTKTLNWKENSGLYDVSVFTKITQFFGIFWKERIFTTPSKLRKNREE